MKKLASLLLIAVIFTACELNVEEQNQDNLVLLRSKVAGPNSVFSLDFSDPSDVADNTAGMAGWVLDRYNPSLGYPPVSFTQAAFDGDDRLRINISETGPTSGFYAYQGKKYQDAGGMYWKTEANCFFSYKFYIDPSWESDGVSQQTGVWPVLGDADGIISAYPILEYQDGDANADGEAGFRVYVYVSDDDGNFVEAKWVYLGIPKQLKIDADKGGWVTVEAQLHKTNSGSVLKWRINNILVVDEREYNVFAPSTQYLEFIFNSANFGEDQDYYYDDIILAKPGFGGN